MDLVAIVAHYLLQKITSKLSEVRAEFRKPLSISRTIDDSNDRINPKKVIGHTTLNYHLTQFLMGHGECRVASDWTSLFAAPEGPGHGQGSWTKKRISATP